MSGYTAAAMLVVAVAGTAISASGQARAADAAGKEAAYKAQVARNNAIIAEQNADYATRAGQAKAAQESLQGAAKLGRIRTAIAAGGLDVNSGSAVDVQESQAEQTALDVETVIHNAQLDAYGYRSQSKNFEAEAGLQDYSGKETAAAGKTEAFGTLLSGASSAGSSWTTRSAKK